MKRPLSLFAFALVVGILLARTTNSYEFIFLSSIFSFAILAIFITLFNTQGILNNTFIIMGMILCYIIGGFEFLYLDKKIKDKYEAFEGERVIIKGIINSEVEIEDDKITCIVLCEEISKDGINFQSVKGNIRLTIIKTAFNKTNESFSTKTSESAKKCANKPDYENNTELVYGNKIELTGILNIPAGKRNPGGFDYRNYLAVSGVSATMYIKEGEIIKIEAGEYISFFRIGNIVRKSIIRIINASLKTEQAGLLNAMLTGYRNGVPLDIESAFRASGLSHILSVSGLHVVFIMMPFIYIFKKAGINRILSNVLVIFVLIFYISITGAQPSVQRAVIMASMILIGQVLYKETDTITGISLACIIILLINPHILFSISFQLSFTATLSIVLLNQNINKMIRRLIKSLFKYDLEHENKSKARFKSGLNYDLLPKNGILSRIKEFFALNRIIKETVRVLSTTISAQLGVFPLGIMYFNEISIISVVSNLLVAPFTGVIMLLGLIMATVGHVSIHISRMLGAINSIFINIVIKISKISAGLPFSVFKAGMPSLLIIIICYMLVWFFLWFKIKNKISINRTFYIYSVLSIILVILIINLMPGQLEVTFLDVGSGDSIFIRTQGGKTILIDGGGEKGKEEGEPNTGEQIIIPFLLDSGVTKLDLVIASHGHADHILGLYPVLEQIRVDNVILPDYKEDNELAKIIDICFKRNIKITYCKEGDYIFLDKFTCLYILNPQLEANRLELGKNEESSLNNNSLVLNLIYKNVKMLFTGDIEKETEELLVETYKSGNMIYDIADIHVLKVPHHGSETSSTEDFVKMVKPKVAIISVGKNNYGHPAETVIERYRSIGAKIYRTDVNGAVMIKTNGKNIRVKVMFDNEH
ncbi:MAG TPA: ComEC/Rec2 family competence protein [Clostridiaceae bacterium]|nr:ComEC/Rec2 family competence protein [Clostridiaceae bacterium]